MSDMEFQLLIGKTAGYDVTITPTDCICGKPFPPLKDGVTVCECGVTYKIGELDPFTQRRIFGKGKSHG